MLHRLFNRTMTAEDVSRLVRDLPRATTNPDRSRLKRIAGSDAMSATTDWMDWSVWEDADRKELWVRYTGGVAGATIWYGPGLTGS
jgi:hypothetical protein